MIQDLIVEETRKEMIFLGETVLQVRALRFPMEHSADTRLQIWERRGHDEKGTRERHKATDVDKQS